MISKLSWILLGAVTLFLSLYFIFVAKPQLGGDIVEYFGVSQSILNHGGINLSTLDQTQLSQILNPGYFNLPGYYLKGLGDQRYPVHFFFYSLLLIPFRLILRLFGLNELRSLYLTNILLFAGTIGLVYRFFLKDPLKRIGLLILLLISPIMSFFIWPGPDMFYVCLVLLAIFSFFKGKIMLAAGLAGIASWHSQPLMVLAIGLLAYKYLLNLVIPFAKIKKLLTLNPQIIFQSLTVVGIILIPYLYNLLVFHILSPWTIIPDGWTKLYGFGVQNMSLQKLFEQFFDLNIGLFWYAPILLVGGLIVAGKEIFKGLKAMYILPLFLLTALFYQTNPAWHYGTSGYGPTRHIIFFIPLMVYFLATKIKNNTVYIGILVSVVIIQLFTLSLNHFLEPNLANTLVQSPYAKLVLDWKPQLYNPTPEIFVDRTNHTDLDIPTSAVYKVDGICKKAYVLKNEKQKLIDQCGFVPSSVENKFEDDFLKIASYPRTLKTLEATFWPQPDSCGEALNGSNFVCMKTVDEVMKYTGISDSNRIKTLPEYPYPGIWKLTFGDPVTITIPPGYIVNYYAVTGFYVDYN